MLSLFEWVCLQHQQRLINVFFLFFFVCSWFLSFSLWKFGIFIKRRYHNVWCHYTSTSKYALLMNYMHNSILSTVYFAGNSSRLPELSSDQALKLKQLTVLTLAETNKVLMLHIWSCFLNPLADVSGWFKLICGSVPPHLWGSNNLLELLQNMAACL